jgi:hypothetical protein
MNRRFENPAFRPSRRRWCQVEARRLKRCDAIAIDLGDHGNAVPDRFQNHVLPFFGRVLSLRK